MTVIEKSYSILDFINNSIKLIFLIQIYDKHKFYFETYHN